MTDPSVAKDIAKLRSHVIDGIEDLKTTIENVEAGQNRIARTLSNIFIIGCVIAFLVFMHLMRHWSVK